MALEDLVGPDKYLSALVPANPTTGDPKREGDDHIRGIKNTILNSFPNIDGPVNASDEDLSVLEGAAAGGGSALLIPIGGIVMFGAASAPAGFFQCNGQAVDRTAYAALFAVIGTAYGSGDGSTTFNLPNFDARAPERGTPGATRGAEAHTLTAAQSGVPAHTHGFTAGFKETADPGSEQRSDGIRRVEDKAGTTAANSAANAAESHPIVGPRLAVEFLIRAQ